VLGDGDCSVGTILVLCPKFARPIGIFGGLFLILSRAMWVLYEPTPGLLRLFFANSGTRDMFPIVARGEKQSPDCTNLFGE